MQLLSYKLFLPLLVMVALLLGTTSVVSARAPHVIVRVEDQFGQPIPGVYVKWVESVVDGKRAGYIYRPTLGASQEETLIDILDTDGSNQTTIHAGEVLFRSWGIPAADGGFQEHGADGNLLDYGPDIDHDFNSSTPNIPQWDNYQGSGFGCGSNPHTFSVSAPANMGIESCETIERSLGNSIAAQKFTIKCQKNVVPVCPNGIKKQSCDQVNKTVTLTWDAPQSGADGYKLYFNKFPFDLVNDSSDVLHPSESNQLVRTQAISFDTPYMLHIRTIKNVDGTRVESESCLAEFRCDSCTPGSPGCEFPDAELTGALCPEKPSDFYYDFTLKNVTTDGQQFVNSKMMMVFYLNAQTQEIMDFLNGNPEGPPYTFTADFSQWRESNISPQQGHYFGYYVQTFTSLPANNTLTFKLDDNTRIGTKTIGQLRQFLQDNSYGTQFVFKANMSTKTSSGVDLFNSHIPLPGAGKIDLARSQDNICRQTSPEECELGTCPTISITNPTLGETVEPVSNRIPVTWTSSDATITEYQVLVYDTSIYSATTANTEYETAMAAGRAPVKVRRYETAGLEQQANVSGLGNAIGVAVRGVVPNPVCSETPAPIPPLCSWTPIDVALGYTVEGKFYLDNQCTSTTGEIPMTGQISANGETIPLNGDDSYSFTLPYTGPHDIVLQISNADYICARENASCPAIVSSNTCKIENITGPGVKNFYVQTALSQYKSWWQVRGGLVYGDGGITSNLPFDTDGNTSCNEPFCKPFLLRREMSEPLGEKTAGVPMTNTGGFNSIINGRWTDRATNNNAHTEGTNNLLSGELKEDSEYFKKLLADKVDDQPSPGTIINSLPTDTRTIVEDAEVWHFTGDLTIKPSSTWNVSNKQVVIVDGSIKFETDGPEQLITVTPGGFLAFIATNDIIFAKEIGPVAADVSDTDSNIEGIFIADRFLKIEGNGAGGDKKFIGAGTFVGWSDVLLQRRFDNPADPGDTANQIKNTNMPVEAFFFRPDFAVNAPEFMQSANYTWKEVN